MIRSFFKVASIPLAALCVFAAVLLRRQYGLVGEIKVVNGVLIVLFALFLFVNWRVNRVKPRRQQFRM